MSPIKSDWAAHRVDPAIAHLWIEHGGDHHGPRVETVTMPMSKLMGFVAALPSPTPETRGRGQMTEMTRINLRIARLIFDVAANVFVAGIAVVVLWIEVRGIWTHHYASGWEPTLLIAWLTAILWVTLMPPLKGRR